LIIKINLKVIYLIIILMLFILCVIFNSCKKAKNIVSTGGAESVEIEIPIQKEKIPIIAWYGVQEHTIDRYLELKECGFDYNYSWFPNVEALAQAMEVANEVGVKIIIYCPELENEPERIASRFKEHPAIAGYFLQDEPNRNDFFRLNELNKRIQTVDKKNFCYINLFPNYASSKQLGIPSYLEHVQLFLQEIPVEILSFDYFPIRVKDKKRYINGDWYENLEIISNEARKAGIPFWAFALATALGPYPIPTLDDLRLQVYSNLAYGAQGIQYFTYWTPFASDIEDFHDGPIDYNTREKTETWYKLQQMNKEIKALSYVFLGANVLQVRHIVKTAFGTNGKVPAKTTRFNFANRPTEANIIKSFKIPRNTNAVISFLENGNRCYMVVINRNLSGGKNVTFKINGGDGLQLINKDGKIVPVSSENSKQTVIPGDVLIYGWDIK
jgi:hypothetical protein